METDSTTQLVLDAPDSFGGRRIAAHPDASKEKRFANFAIDWVTRFLLVALGSIAYALLNPEVFLEVDQEASGGVGELLAGRLFDFVVGALVTIAYYTAFEGATGGRSLGKYLTGTRAVRIDGARFTSRDAFARSLWRVVPFEAFSFFGSDVSGWHDTKTDTRVVDLRKELIE